MDEVSLSAARLRNIGQRYGVTSVRNVYVAGRYGHALDRSEHQPRGTRMNCAKARMSLGGTSITCATVRMSPGDKHELGLERAYRAAVRATPMV